MGKKNDRYRAFSVENRGACARTFSLGEQALRKMNGREAPESLDLSALAKCADQMVAFGNSFAQFEQLPNCRKIFLRGAIKAALGFDYLPKESEAFGRMLNIRGECRRPDGPAFHYRQVVRRFLQYCYTRPLPTE